MSNYLKPICCPPKYVVHNEFVRRVQPIIQPVVHVNRVNVVTVPQRIVRPIRVNEVVERRRNRY